MVWLHLYAPLERHASLMSFLILSSSCIFAQKKEYEDYRIWRVLLLALQLVLPVQQLSLLSLRYRFSTLLLFPLATLSGASNFDNRLLLQTSRYSGPHHQKSNVTLPI